jgi:hypothetical protein
VTVGERYVSQVEAARLAGISKDSVIRARRAGRLAGCRLVEGRWLVPVSALAAGGFGSADTEPSTAETGTAPEGTALPWRRSWRRPKAAWPRWASW